MLLNDKKSHIVCKFGNVCPFLPRSRFSISIDHISLNQKLLFSFLLFKFLIEFFNWVVISHVLNWILNRRLDCFSSLLLTLEHWRQDQSGLVKLSLNGPVIILNFTFYLLECFGIEIFCLTSVLTGKLRLNLKLLLDNKLFERLSLVQFFKLKTVLIFNWQRIAFISY